MCTDRKAFDLVTMDSIASLCLFYKMKRFGGGIEAGFGTLPNVIHRGYHRIKALVQILQISKLSAPRRWSKVGFDTRARA
jgi:hypothetical protein